MQHPTPTMNAVDSSLIDAIGYEVATARLHVRFHSGPTWVYGGVPQEMYSDLMNSDSVGKYYTRNIKGQFPGEKV